MISFDTCKDDEFNCEKGYCIPLDRRCDLKNDCEDKSDEEVVLEDKHKELYDHERKEIDYRRLRATNIKNNPRVHLPNE